MQTETRSKANHKSGRSPQRKPDRVFSDSEVGRLRRLMIHSPDGGLGKIIPSKALDWLFEDIVHLETLRRKEYDLYVKLLLYFLDPDKVSGRLAEIDAPENDRTFYKPCEADYFSSDALVDPERLLAETLENDRARHMTVGAVAATENCSYQNAQAMLRLPSVQLAQTLLSGTLPTGEMIFPPIPNFIFTRDVATVIGEHIVLHKPKVLIRQREGRLIRQILRTHALFEPYRDRMIELADNPDFFLLSEERQNRKRVTSEGGDMMSVAPRHALIGQSERTSVHGVNKIVKALFERDAADKVTVVRIPEDRQYMHIDTLFTQVKRNLWVIYAPFSRAGQDYERSDVMAALGESDEGARVEILQFQRGRADQPTRFEYLEDLFDDISRHELGAGPCEFLYSGGNVFPYGHREQWTDSCNVLALNEGVVIGYDRNDRTAAAFAERGFSIREAGELIEAFERGDDSPDALSDTLILLPSGELSRARGGPHCISMPLFREPVV